MASVIRPAALGRQVSGATEVSYKGALPPVFMYSVSLNYVYEANKQGLSSGHNHHLDGALRLFGWHRGNLARHAWPHTGRKRSLRV